ncbi:hypothetical protein NCPPB3778_16 [Rathayibacter phage NCPPB3778]|nr:hypothetical protein NCPPB3778_16 [Rathayibacter phage NCPPB3778]
MSKIISFTIAGLKIMGRPDGISEPKGIYLGPEGASSWYEVAEMERDVVKRPWSDGSYDSRGSLSDRTLSFSGVIVSPSQQETEEICRRVRGTMADGSIGDVSDGFWRMRGRLSGKTKAVPRATNPRIADWMMTVWCPDPRKYGEIRTFTAAQPAYHKGNFGALPTIFVTGVAPSGYTITGTDGAQFVVQAALTSGQTHEIRMSDGLVRQGGYVLTGASTTPRTWVIPPGRDILHTATNGVSLTVTVTDTDI